MSEKILRLGSITLSCGANSTVSIYYCSTSCAVVSGLMITNSRATDEYFTLLFCPSSNKADVTQKDYLFSSTEIEANKVAIFNIGLCMPNDSTLFGNATTSSIQCNVFGTEIS